MRCPLNKKQLNRATSKIASVFGGSELTRLAEATGFTKRLRTVIPSFLVLSLSNTLGTKKVETIADLHRGYIADTGKRIEYRPFYNQLAKDSFPEFMRQSLLLLVSKCAMSTLEPVPGSGLRMFKDIIMQDGSSFAVKDDLQAIFKGRFTKISPAAVELHATYSLFNDACLRIALAPDSEGERQFLPDPQTLRGILSLADRGYADVDYCHRVDSAGGFFVFRMLNSINPWVQWSWGGHPLRRTAVQRTLRMVMHRYLGKTADLDVEWTRKGKTIALRLLLVWNPSLKKHMFLLTNLDRNIFDAEAVRALYSLRWQVELLFKEWKSYANLHKFNTSNSNIVEGLIWASLAASELKRFLAHATQAVFAGVETSTRKVAMAAAHHLPAIAKSIIRGRGLRIALRKALEFLAFVGRRAHPDRDRRTGRLARGLRPVRSGAT